DPQRTETSVDAVAKLRLIRSDGYGEFAVEVPASLWNGVDGVFVALLYDLDLGNGTFSWLLELLLHARPPQAFERLDLQSAFGTSFVSSALTEAQGAPPDDALKGMYLALEELLERTEPELRKGVVRLRFADPAPGAVSFVSSTERGVRPAQTVDRGFAFAVASCQYPAGMLDEIVADA